MAVFIVATVVTSCQRPAAIAVAPMSGKRVESDRGMVAASHPDAASAGAAILAQGGNAIDAFAATAFALAVTDVSQTGLGGGGAMTFFNAKTRTVEHLSFYPRAGEDAEWARADSSRGRRAGRAAATPGMVAGVLEAHSKWGKLTRAQVMAPAIALARDGFVVSPLLARTIVTSRDKLMADSLAAARFMPRGEALRPGDRLIQPELAVTLQRIASEGATVFYNGGIAERLSAKVKAQGGLITVRDMNTYFVTSMRPLCTMWRGYTLLGAPPPMGGASVLEMLQMADAAGVADAGSFTENGAAVAKLADIMRIGDADAGAYRGDPAVQRVPAHGVVHPDFARQRAGLVGGALPDTAIAGNPWAFDTLASPSNCGRFNPYPTATALRTGSIGSAMRDTTTVEEGESFTSHLAVVDGDGSAVSATTTVGVLFGSGVYTDGFFLNSAGSNFDAKTRGTNRYANSTMSPTLILGGDKVRLVVGAAGSQYIQPAITQVTIRMLAFGEDPAIALSAPRIHASDNVKEVEVEPGFATSVYQALVTRGYAPASRVRDISFGGVHAVFVRKDGKRIGVADPRRDGTAAGW
ncbi:gamma-glutamyltransferase family protein [Gemmatimonas sp.]|uniref:gamma-glutamyltransferase family protein n=1 Tax=Gemmatimonas sp. TaxID=1962908 RepID=UPI003561EA88